MEFSVQKLQTSGSEPLYFDDYADISEVEEMNNDIRKIAPVHVKGYAVTQGNEITFSFEISGKMILPCARTLADVEYPFKVDAIEVFSTSSYYREEETLEVHPVNGEMLDLTPYIKENVLLEIPFRVFSQDEQVLKNALTKGEGWELQTEEVNKEKIDPRLEKLQQFFQDNEENR